MRATATTMPSATPATMAIAVSSSVSSRPCRMRSEKSICPTTSHSKRGLVATDRTTAAATRATVRAAIQRPGRRTGTASIGCMRLGGGLVDAGLGDRAGLDAVLGQDAAVGAVVDERLHRLLHRLDQRRALRERDAIGRRAVRLPHDL